MAREQFLYRYRPEFDGLRGLACLIVLVGHALAVNVPAGYIYVRGIPKIGVWLFFSLSAFLLTLKLIESGLSGRSIAYYGYTRALRILPMSILAVFFYLETGLLGIRTLDDAFAVLTFQRVGGHLWTIPVELGFYVFLPALLFVCNLASERWKPVVALLVYAMAIVIWAPWHTPENSLFVGWYLSAFIPSVIAAMVARPAERGWLVGSSLAVAVVYALAFKCGLLGDWKIGLLNKFYVYGPIFALTVYGLHTSKSIWNAIFSNRAMVLVGEASFSIYLFHWAICVWARAVPSFVAVPLAVLASIIVGVIGSRLIEMPLYALRKRTPFGPRAASASKASA